MPNSQNTSRAAELFGQVYNMDVLILGLILVVNDRFGGIYHLSGCWIWWTGDFANDWGFLYGADIGEDDTGWAFHATHGWLFMFGGSVSDVLWIYSAQNGWLAASAAYGPRFYDVSSQSWMDWN